MIRIASTLAILTALPGLLPAQDWFVDAAVANPGNGRSWTSAFPTLQAALAAARSGQEIWVAQGTYRQTGGFTVPPGVTVRGNFTPGDTRPTQRDAIGSRATVLDGGNQSRVLTAGSGEWEQPLVSN